MVGLLICIPTIDVNKKEKTCYTIDVIAKVLSKPLTSQFWGLAKLLFSQPHLC